jgi:hypothetical protein
MTDALLRRMTPAAVLGAGIIAMLGVLLYVSRWMVFWGDEWNIVYARTSFTAPSFFAPFVDTNISTTVLIYQVLLPIFGLRLYLPYLVVDWVAHFCCAILLYRIVARRTGPPIALAAALSLVFLGSAWEALFHAFQIQWILAALFGLAAVDLLDDSASRSPLRTALAIASMALSVASGSVGLVFVATIAAWGLVSRDVRRIATAVVGALLYLAWSYVWSPARANVGTLAPFDTIVATAFGLGAGVSAVVGLPPARFAPLGAVIAAACMAIAAVACARGWRPDPLAVGAVAGLLAEYVGQSITRGYFGVEHGARSGYGYPAAILIWLVVAGAFAGRVTNVSRRLLAAGAVLLALAIVGNMRQFVGAARGDRVVHATEIAGLRMIESIAANPAADLDARSPAYAFASVHPRSYLDAIRRYGTPSVGFDWEREANQDEVADYRRRLLPGS